MAKLYEISNELYSLLASCDDELTPELEDKFASLQMSMEAKVEGVLQYRQCLLRDVEGIESEIERLQARADSMSRKAEWAKDYVYRSLVQTNIIKMSTLTFTATVAKSPPRVVLEGNDIPEGYRREKVTVDLDRKKALDDHKEGKKLPPEITIVQGTYLKVT